MVEFVSNNAPIHASRKRVVSIAFGDIDRLQLDSDALFTGSVVLVNVFTLTAKFQYHVVFYSLANKIMKIWHAQPEEVSLSESSKFEDDLNKTLQARGISLTNVQQDSPNFNVLLSRLPMAFDDENATSPAALFPVSGLSSAGGDVTDEEKADFRALLAQT